MGGRFGINCPRGFLKILKLPEFNEGNFNFQKSRGLFIRKIAQTRHVITSQSHQTGKHFIETTLRSRINGGL